MPDYTGLDVRPCRGADFVRPAWDIPASLGGVDEVYSRHMLEHLDPNDARRTLAAWRRALRPGGLLRLIVPDLAFHARQLLGQATSWTQEATENQEHAMAGFFGWRDETRGGDREDAHRWGYTWESLAALLNQYDFEQIERVTQGVDSEPWHLHVTARAPVGDVTVDAGGGGA